MVVGVACKFWMCNQCHSSIIFLVMSSVGNLQGVKKVCLFKPSLKLHAEMKFSLWDIQIKLGRILA